MLKRIKEQNNQLVFLLTINAVAIITGGIIVPIIFDLGLERGLEITILSIMTTIIILVIVTIISGWKAWKSWNQR